MNRKCIVDRIFRVCNTLRDRWYVFLTSLRYV